MTDPRWHPDRCTEISRIMDLVIREAARITNNLSIESKGRYWRLPIATDGGWDNIQLMHAARHDVLDPLSKIVECARVVFDDFAAECAKYQENQAQRATETTATAADTPTEDT